MPAEAALHASAVAIDGRALLIVGPSRSGKSHLALALIARSTPSLPIELVGDDRILLRPDGHGLLAAPHPRIAGFIERRGLGIVAMPWRAPAPVGGVIRLGAAGGAAAPVAETPHLAFTDPGEADARSALVLAWWRTRDAANAPHPNAKAHAAD